MTMLMERTRKICRCKDGESMTMIEAKRSGLGAVDSEGGRKGGGS